MMKQKGVLDDFKLRYEQLPKVKRQPPEKSLLGDGVRRGRYLGNVTALRFIEPVYKIAIAVVGLYEQILHRLR